MKKFVIIGASSGIGKTLSEQLVEEGHIVYGSYHKSPITNSAIRSFNLNVLDEDPDIKIDADTIDGLAYLPGSIHLKPFHRIQEKSFIEDFRLQVSGAIKVIQQLLPRLKKAELASILLFSTVAVDTGFNFHSMVSVSKGAIQGLTKSLAAELAPSIRVNCIAPSLTKTPLAKKLLSTEEKIEANANRHALRRIGHPDDIASMAKFLLTEPSSWITGQVIKIDGGMSTLKI